MEEMIWSPFPWIEFDDELVSDLKSGIEENRRDVDTRFWEIRLLSYSVSEHQFWITTKKIPVEKRDYDFRWSTSHHRMLDPEWVKEQDQTSLDTWNYAILYHWESSYQSDRWYNNTVPTECSPIRVYPDHVVIDDVFWFLMVEQKNRG